MTSLSRREALTGFLGLAATVTLPQSVMAAERNETRRAVGLPEFPTYSNPNFGRKEHEAFHASLEAEHGFARDPRLKRWNADPARVYVNENAGESIHITGVNLEENYVEMVWVLAPSYRDENGNEIVAHVPFEHQHGNQDEVFEKISGDVTAQVNGVLMQGTETDFFTAHAEDDHIAWNPGTEPLAMRVRYYPGFGQDGERALMVYWGFVDDVERTKAEGQPVSFPLLGALNMHLGPQALASDMPKWLPALARPFLINPLDRAKVATLYRELTGEEHPLV